MYSTVTEYLAFSFIRSLSAATTAEAVSVSQSRRVRHLLIITAISLPISCN